MFGSSFSVRKSGAAGKRGANPRTKQEISAADDQTSTKTEADYLASSQTSAHATVTSALPDVSTPGETHNSETSQSKQIARSNNSEEQKSKSAVVDESSVRQTMAVQDELTKFVRGTTAAATAAAPQHTTPSATATSIDKGGAMHIPNIDNVHGALSSPGYAGMRHRETKSAEKPSRRLHATEQSTTGAGVGGAQPTASVRQSGDAKSSSNLAGTLAGAGGVADTHSGAVAIPSMDHIFHGRRKPFDSNADGGGGTDEVLMFSSDEESNEQEMLMADREQQRRQQPLQSSTRHTGMTPTNTNKSPSSVQMGHDVSTSVTSATHVKQQRQQELQKMMQPYAEETRSQREQRRRDNAMMQLPTQARHKLAFYGALQNQMQTDHQGEQFEFTDNVQDLLHMSMDARSLVEHEQHHQQQQQRNTNVDLSLEKSAVRLEDVSTDNEQQRQQATPIGNALELSSIDTPNNSAAATPAKKIVADKRTPLASPRRVGTLFGNGSVQAALVEPVEQESDMKIFHYNPKKGTLKSSSGKKKKPAATPVQTQQHSIGNNVQLDTAQKRRKINDPLGSGGELEQIGGRFDILDNGGAHQFRNWPFSLEDVPSADGTINPRTGRPTRVVEQPNLPYGPEWIRERMSRRLAFLADPIYRFVARTAGFANSRVETFWQAPETSFQSSGRRGGQAQGLFRRATEDRRTQQQQRPQENEQQRTQELLDQDTQLQQLRTTLQDARRALGEANVRVQIARGTVTNPNATEAQKQEAREIINTQTPLITQSTAEVATLEKQIQERQIALIQSVQRTTALGRLINRANPQDDFVRAWLNFLDQLSRNPDPTANSFVRAIERATQEEFNQQRAAAQDQQGFLTPLAPFTEDRVQARRLWIQLPENLGVFFWDNIFDAALQAAYEAVIRAARTNVLLYDLMTQSNVSTNFARLTADFIRRARSQDSTRFTTKNQQTALTREIRRLIEWFKHVRYSGDWQLLYMGRDPYKSQLLEARRSMLEVESRGTDYSDRPPTQMELSAPLVVDF